MTAPAQPTLPFLDTAGETEVAPADPFGDLLGELASLGSDLDAASPEIGALLAQALKRVGKTEVQVTFSGHFNAGKSTLLNAALGRSLLPMDELPETGTIWRLRPGRDDAGLLRTKNGIQPIPCTTEVIRHYCSVLSGEGERRDPEAIEQELEMVLQGSPIPPQVCWADSPGINDTGTMDERAFLAASEADLVVWVVNSRQPFSEPEDDFLRRVVEHLGPKAVVFVLNAFLRKETPEGWLEFSQEIEPALRTRLADHREAMGMPPDLTPPMIAVCAKAGLQTEEQEFGVPGLQPFVSGLQGRDLPRVRISRLHRLAAALDQVAGKIQERLESVRAEAAAAEVAARKLAAKDTRELQRLKPIVESAVGSFFLTCAEKAKGCAAKVSAAIGKPIIRDQSYSLQLTACMTTVAENAIDILVANLNTEAMISARKAIPDDQVKALKELLKPAQANLAVARNPPKGKGMNKGYLVALSYGFILAPLGMAIGAGLGAFVGRAISSAGFVAFAGAVFGFFMGRALALKKGARISRDEAEATDIAETKANVGGAIARVVSELESRRAKMIEFLIHHFSSPVDFEATGSAGVLEVLWQALGKTAVRLASTARDIRKANDAVSAIGIDYQATVPLLALREGNPGSARINDVGDGARALMPNIAATAGAWASACLSSQDGGGQFRGRPGPEGVWLEEPGASLVLARPGRPAAPFPVRRRADAGDRLRARGRIVRRQLRGGGGRRPGIGPGRRPVRHRMLSRRRKALLCHWLTNAETASASPLSVVAVVCSGFDLDLGLRPPPRVRARPADGKSSPRIAKSSCRRGIVPGPAGSWPRFVSAAARRRPRRFCARKLRWRRRRWRLLRA